MQKLLKRRRVVFLALDHGFSMGPIVGLENLGSTVKMLVRCNIDAIILHRGAIKNLPSDTFEYNSPPIIMHLAGGGVSHGGNKFLTADPYQGLLWGATAVSFQVNIGAENEEKQIEEASRLIEHADNLELPTLLMIYDKRKDKSTEEQIKKSVRLGIELGADMVKIDPGNDFKKFKRGHPSFANSNSCCRGHKRNRYVEIYGQNKKLSRLRSSWYFRRKKRLPKFRSDCHSNENL